MPANSSSKAAWGCPRAWRGRWARAPATPLRLASDGDVHGVRVRVVLGGSGLPSLAASPVAVAVLGVAQALAEQPGRVTEVLIRPLPGDAATVSRELQRLAAGRLDVRPADDELRLLDQATGPNRQSTSLFSAIA